MTNQPRPKRFPFALKWHLSTAILLMFVAGGLLWANIDRHGESPLHSGTELVDSQLKNFIRSYGCYGWPFTVYSNGRTIMSQRAGLTRRWMVRNGPWEPDSPYVPVLANVLIALSILFLVGFVCEWLVRRRRSDFNTNSISN